MTHQTEQQWLCIGLWYICSDHQGQPVTITANGTRWVNWSQPPLAISTAQEKDMTQTSGFDILQLQEADVRTKTELPKTLNIL